VDKIRALEGMLAEHDAIKQEVSAMRELMEERKREIELLRLHTQSPSHHRRQGPSISDLSDEFVPDDDDDDRRSINTVVPHELERVDEEDEEQLAADEEAERRNRRDEVRPRTPEPTGMGMSEDDDEHEPLPSHTESNTSLLRPQSPTPAPAVPDELAQRMTSLSAQLESALELSRTLQQQHSTAQSTISLLESKVAALEALVQATQAQVQAQTETQQYLAQAVEDAKAAAAAVSERPAVTSAPEDERESITQMLNSFKKNVEGQWSTVQEEWNEERERLRRAREEWEIRVRAVETGLEAASAKVDTGLASMASFQAQQHHIPNGHAKVTGNHGLATPPSPRSLSADSTRSRQKKRRSSSARGRSPSRSCSASPTPEPDNGLAGQDLDEVGSSISSRLRRRGSWTTDDSDGSGAVATRTLDDGEVRAVPQYLLTPEPSLLEQPVSGRMPVALAEARKERPKDLVSDPASPSALEHHAYAVSLQQQQQQQPINHNNVQTALGVILVAAAAAAVMWRVKPDGS
jgi:hypothetical protein